MTTAEPFVLISSPDSHQEFEQKYQRSIGESRLNADLGAPKVPMANNDDIWFCPPALQAHPIPSHSIQAQASPFHSIQSQTPPCPIAFYSIQPCSVPCQDPIGPLAFHSITAPSMAPHFHPGYSTLFLYIPSDSISFSPLQSIQTHPIPFHSILPIPKETWECLWSCLL